MWTGSGFGPPRTALFGASPRAGRRALRRCWFAGVALVASSVVVTPATAAPPDRALEFVGPAFKTGGGASVTVASIDGDRVLLRSQAGFAGAELQDGFSNDYLAVRGGSGWRVSSLSLGFVNPLGRTDGAAFDVTPDLRRSLVRLQLPDGAQHFVIRDDDGTLTVVTPPIPAAVGSKAVFIGQAADFRHLAVMTTGVHLLPSDTTAANKVSLYEATGTGDAAAWRQINVDNAGAVIGPDCGAVSPALVSSSFNAVSRDGQTFYFAAQPGTGSCALAGTRPREIFARIGGTQTVQVSANTCTRTVASPHGACATAKAHKVFEGASDDGKRVFFTTTQQLADSDWDTGRDIYEYDFAPASGQPNLVQVTAGDATDTTPGSGAGLAGVTRISDDGSRVYFVASGVLTMHPNGRGQIAQAGARNLYVVERDAAHPTGLTSFVTALSPAASATAAADDGALWSTADNRPAQVAGGPDASTPSDGRVLVFTSYEQLVSDDHDTADDVYRYADSDGSLTCVSCAGNTNGMDALIFPPGWNGGSGGSATIGRAIGAWRRVTDDGGTVVFRTKEGLTPGDTDGLEDAYEWRDGTLRQVTGGQEGLGTAQFVLAPSGGTIFFATTKALLPFDVDTSQDVYAARVGGGFPPPQAPPPPCAGDACQDPGHPEPAVPVPGAAAGDGNERHPPPTLTVAPISAVQRTALARTGRLTFTVAASDPGLVTVRARARIRGRQVRIATDKRSLATGGTAGFALRMPRSARAELRRSGRLTLQIAVSHSRVAVVATTTVRITAATRGDR